MHDEHHDSGSEADEQVSSNEGSSLSTRTLDLEYVARRIREGEGRVAGGVDMRDYIFVKELGRGSFGRVERRTHIPTGAQVAIKFIPRTDGAHDQPIQREFDA